MKKYKALIITSLVAAALIALPLVSSAKTTVSSESHYKYNSSYQSSNGDGMSRISYNDSWWGRFWNNIWDYRHANAQSVNQNENDDEDNDEDNDNRAPHISGITAPTVLRTGQLGTWKVMASDPEDGSLTYSVDWDDDNATESMNALQRSFVQTSTFTHSYSQPGNHKIKFTVEDEDGRKAYSSVTVHVRGGAIENAPVISNLKAVSHTPHTARISWKTDVRANGSVWFDPSSPVDTSGSPDVLRKGKVRNHVVILRNLEEDTDYYLIVGSENTGGMTKSSEIKFTTKDDGDDNTDPVISNVNVDTDTTTTTITWTTDEPSNSKVYYSTSTPVDVNTASFFTDSSLVTSHSIVVSGLTTGTLYHYILESKDASNNTALSSEATFTTD